MTRLVLVGAGGHGKVVADTAIALGYTDISFLDQNYPNVQANSIWPVIAKTRELPTQQGPFFLSIGNNTLRARLWEKFNILHSPILIHPSAIISPQASIGDGSVVVAGVIVNCETRIGLGAILNTGCSVDHDCILENFVHISPGARLAGGVTIGSRAWIGIGAIIREGITIGKDAIIGAGAIVINDVPNGTTVVGNPAEPIGA